MMQVYKVVDKGTGMEYACKLAPVHTQVLGESAIREVKALMMLNHPNVVHIYYSWTQNLHGDESQPHCCTLLELCDYSMTDLISKCEFNINLERVKSIIRQLCSGMSFVHERGIIHRDLKPDNILFSNDHVLKICDFGIAVETSPGEVHTPQMVTANYRAPEIILGATTYTTSVDLWSIGCIVAELFKGDLLFEGNCEISVLNSIVKLFGRLTHEDMSQEYDLPVLDSISFSGKMCYKSQAHFSHCLSQDPEARGFVLSLLRLNADNRMSCGEALQHEFLSNVETKSDTPMEYEPIIPSIFQSNTEGPSRQPIYSDISSASTVSIDVDGVDSDTSSPSRVLVDLNRVHMSPSPVTTRMDPSVVNAWLNQSNATDRTEPSTMNASPDHSYATASHPSASIKPELTSLPFTSAETTQSRSNALPPFSTFLARTSVSVQSEASTETESSENILTGEVAASSSSNFKKPQSEDHCIYEATCHQAELVSRDRQDQLVDCVDEEVIVIADGVA